jgi:hypothetical protein
MNLKKTFSELMTNKYFLYFIVFLSATNIIGYLTMNNNDAVIFFALVGFLMFNFSKNMTIVLLVSIITTNLFMVSKPLRSMEGFKEGATTSRGSNTSGRGGRSKTEIPDAMEGLENNQEEEEEEGIKEGTRSGRGGRSSNEVDDATGGLDGYENKEDEGEEGEQLKPGKPIREGASKTGKSGGSGFTNPAPVKKSSHIDYATTLEDAYKNLENMLGTGGLQNLTADTKKLMEQQTQLFNSMENIAPLLSQAQNMMKGMDVDQLNKFAGSAKSFNKTDV